MELWCHGGGTQTNPFSRLLSSVPGPDAKLIEGGFAYVSLSGALKLKNAIESCPSLLTVPKRLYVGIHHGITEPKAIRLLTGMKNADVFVVSPTQRINFSALTARPIFHPKYCAVFCEKSADRWLIGSANLTEAAVGLGANIEMGAISQILGSDKSAARKAIHSWQKSYNDMLLKVTDPRILQYEKVRLKFLQKHPIVLDKTDSADDLSVAKSLFIEVGAASGMDRHQVEFNKNLATFFGSVSTSRRDLTLRKGNRVWDGRPLTPKRTTFDVDIYRLGMPTIRSNGVKISERAIRFTRTSDADKFDFDVDDLGGSKYSSWVKECNAQGHLGNTSGGRAFGYVL